MDCAHILWITLTIEGEHHLYRAVVIKTRKTSPMRLELTRLDKTRQDLTIQRKT